jgi:carboxymethylenebutenolidase
MGYMIELMYDEVPLDAYEATPRGEIKGGIIVIHEIWGLNDHTKDIAERFATEGYYVVAPSLLNETDITKHAAQLQLDYFNPAKRSEAQPVLRGLMTPMHEPGFGARTLGRIQTCFDYLYDKPLLNKWVAVNGYCFGGTYSYKLAEKEPKLKAAVPYYGHVNLEEQDKLKAIKSPILAFYGEKDDGLMGDLPDVKKAMKEAGVDYTAKVYPDCAHAFFNDTNPYAYNESAAKDSWNLMLDFLARHKQ